MFLFATLIVLPAQKQKGTIKGKVTDKNTKENLIGANVLIWGETIGSSTDIHGEYVIENIPVGTYTIRFSYVGYESIVKTDIVVKPERITFVNVELAQSAVES